MAALLTGTHVHPDKFNTHEHKKLQPECLIGFSVFLFECLILLGLSGEAGEDFSVCAEFYHLGLPAGFSGGGAKDFITFLDSLFYIHFIQSVP